MMGDGSNAPGRVAITGMGLVTSLGLDVRSTWSAVMSGRVGFGPMSAMESALPPGSTGGQAPELPAAYSPGLAREARYLRWTIEQALGDAGLDPGSAYPAARRFALFGTTLHGIRAGGRFLRTGDCGQLRDFLAASTAACALRGLGVEGGAATTCSACSSSLGAIALGITLLSSGHADVVIAGGYDAIGEYVWSGFNSLRLISPGAVRPFAKGREGMKIAEGYGIVILERERDALQRRARVHAVIDGWGETADAHHLTQPHPQGLGAARAMRLAMAGVGGASEPIGLVSAHATATPDNDAAEYQALRAVFGPRLPETNVVGFKSYVGHTLGAAGAVELILSACAMNSGRVPACANVTPEQVEFEGLRVAPKGGGRVLIERTLNTSLGFGGANACVTMTRARADPGAPRPSPPRRPAIEAWITGVGLVLPAITDPRALVERLAAGDGVFDDAAASASIDDAQLARVMNVRRARRLSPGVKFMLASVTLAVKDARLDQDAARLSDADAILASTHGSPSFCSEFYGQVVREGAQSANPVLFAEGVPNAPAAHVSTTFGLGGACQVIIGSRNSGLDALGLASLRIGSGACDRIIVGASEESHPILERAYRHFGLRHADVDTTGGVACGVAFVVESGPAARARGAPPLAGIASWRTSGARRRGAASNVLHVLRHLGPVEHVLGSANRTWIDRAESLGLRRLGWTPTLHTPLAAAGEFSAAGPLLAVAWALFGRPWPRWAAISTDVEGSASGVIIERASTQLPGP